MSETPEEKHKRIKELYLDVRSLQPDERMGFLDRACGEDSDLRAQVEHFLADQENADRFFEKLPEVLGKRFTEMEDTFHTFSEGDVVAGRFKITRFIGEGGMGEVYEAEDPHLEHERLALKTVHPEIADEHAVDRLKREIRLARRITHPNVCRVFDVFQHVPQTGEPITFFTMELLAGQSLAERLQQKGPMSPEAALPLIEKMADGLGAAHNAGIIHHDFKPANVMLIPLETGDERVVVMDFGLAQAVQPGSAAVLPPPSSRAWVTPQYMAPEQLEGAEVSFATDIYAFGAVVYEMLTGKLMFEATSPLELVAKKLQDPRWPEDAVPGLSVQWKNAIIRCLQVKPSLRFRNVTEFMTALTERKPEWVALYWVAGLTAVLIVSVLWAAPTRIWLGSSAQWATSAVGDWFTPERHITVLPFENSSKTADNDAFSRGLLIAVTSRLETLARFQRKLWVVSGKDVLASGVDSPEKADRVFGANLILTGRLSREKDQLHMLISLARTGPASTPPKTRSIDLSTQDQALLEMKIVTAVGQLLELNLPSPLARGITAGGTRDSAAAEIYLRGLGYLERGPAALDEAIELFNSALSHDPGFALAQATLSEAYLQQYDLTKDAAFIQKAGASCDEAIRIDSQLASFHATRGLVYKATGQHERALQEYQEALRIDPLNADTHRSLAVLQESQGAIKAAEDTYRRAIALQSGYWEGYEELGSFFFRHGRYAEAETNFLAGLRYAPDNARVIRNLAGLYILTERFTAAEIELRKGLALNADSILYNNLGWVYIFQQRYDDAIGPLETATGLPAADSKIWGNLARAYRWAGMNQKAADAYQKAMDLARREISTDPRNPEIRANLAYMLAEVGQKNSALAEIRYARETAPNDVTVLFTSAIVYELASNRDAALEALRAALQGGHSNTEIRKHPDLKLLRQDARYPQLFEAPARNTSLH